jgi:(p)ppGpp synthase/HD superfamily hydrolase
MLYTKAENNPVSNAVEYMISWFRDHMDDAGREPVFFHSLHVMMQMDTTREMVVAVLHDIPENFGVSIDDIADMLGMDEEQANALRLLIHYKNEPYLEYIKKIMVSGNEIAIKVKLADIMHNESEKRLCGLPEDRQKRLKQKYKEAFKLMMSYGAGSE